VFQPTLLEKKKRIPEVAKGGGERKAAVFPYCGRKGGKPTSSCSASLQDRGAKALQMVILHEGEREGIWRAAGERRTRRRERRKDSYPLGTNKRTRTLYKYSQDKSAAESSSLSHRGRKKEEVVSTLFKRRKRRKEKSCSITPSEDPGMVIS